MSSSSGAKKVSPAEAPTRAATPFNVEAKVFVPSSSGEIRKTSSSFNPNAEEFVPMGSVPIKDPRESVLKELMEVIASAGKRGVEVNQLPLRYEEFTGKSLVFEEVSEAVDALGDRVVIEGDDGGSGEVSEVACGRHAGKVVIDRVQWEHTEELEIFKRMIVVVVREFCRRSGAMGSNESPHIGGLTLSLFAAEWDRYYQGSHNLKSLRERFGVVKLMPFLRTIKELDLVGVHPEVRVRVKTEYMGELPVAADPRGDLKNILPFLASPGEYPPTSNVELLTELTGALPKGCGGVGGRLGLGLPPMPSSMLMGRSMVQGGTPSAATAVVAQQLLRSQQELMQQLVLGGSSRGMGPYRMPFMGAGSSAAIDSLMEELLSTSSPDLGHVEEVVKQLECVNGDLSENDEETFSRDMWLSLGTFRRLIVKAVEVVCREQDIKWRGMGGRVERSLVIGCSSAELAEKWEEMYPQLQPLESFYLPYFGVDDPERFQSAFPELWVVRLGERTCDVRVSTMGHVEKYCSMVPGRKGVEEKLKEQLRRLLTELVWRRCQEQRLEEVDRRARRGEGECGERLREERRKMEYAVEEENEVARSNTERRQGRRPAPIDTSRSPERGGGGKGKEEVVEVLEGIEVEGVLVEEVKKVWYEVYSRHLQALLDMCGVRKVLTLLRSCPCIVVEGEGLEARCLVRVRRPLVSVQPFARPSIVTPETVPLPTPMKGGVPQSQGGVDEEEEERLAMEKLLRQLIMHHDGEREEKEEKEEKELTYSKEKMLSVRTAMLRYGVLEGPLVGVAAIKRVSEKKAPQGESAGRGSLLFSMASDGSLRSSLDDTTSSIDMLSEASIEPRPQSGAPRGEMSHEAATAVMRGEFANGGRERVNTDDLAAAAARRTEALLAREAVPKAGGQEVAQRVAYAVPKMGVPHNTAPPPHLAQNVFVGPVGGRQAVTRLPSFLSSPSAYDAMLTAAMLRQDQQYRVVAGGSSLPSAGPPRMVLPNQLQRKEVPVKVAQKRPLAESTAAAEVQASVKKEEAQVKVATTPIEEHQKKAAPKARSTPPSTGVKRRRVNAKGKGAVGGDANGVVFDKQHVVKMMGKGVQAGSQLQEMRGEVGELPKPKQPVMTAPLEWQASHQMPSHSLQDAFEVWAFCCHYSDSLVGIPARPAGEFADALFARTLTPLMQRIHLALLRLVVPHVVALSARESSDKATCGALPYLPLKASSTTLTLGWQCLVSETILTLAKEEGRREEIEEGAKWMNLVEYKDIPVRVRITVIKALLDSCRVSPLYVRYRACVSVALERGKVLTARLARIENESMAREVEIGRDVITERIEDRRRELEQLESRLRSLNHWAKFGEMDLSEGESKEEEEPAVAMAIDGEMSGMSLVPLCREGVGKELRKLSKRRRVVSAVRQQGTRALLRLAPDEMTGQLTAVGVDRAGHSYFVIPQVSSTAPCVCVRYSNGALGFYQTKEEVEGLVVSLDQEPSRAEGKLRRQLVERTAKDLEVRESFPPDLRSVEGLTCLESGNELREIVKKLRNEADRLLKLTVETSPIVEVNEGYNKIKAVVKPVELPSVLSADALVSAEEVLGERVGWTCPEERQVFLATLGRGSYEFGGNDGSREGWWEEYERGCNEGSVEDVVAPLNMEESKDMGSDKDKSPVVASAPMIRWPSVSTPKTVKSEHQSPMGGSVSGGRGQVHECKECGRIFKSQGGLTQHTNRGCKGPSHAGTPHSSDASSPQVEVYPSAPREEGGELSSPILAMCLGWLLDRVDKKN